MVRGGTELDQVTEIVQGRVMNPRTERPSSAGLGRRCGLRRRRAGSAGCAVACRLVEAVSPCWTKIATFAFMFRLLRPLLYRDKVNWNFHTEPVEYWWAAGQFAARQGAGRLFLDKRDALCPGQCR